MLNRLNELIEEKENFGFETTLTTLSYKNYIRKAKKAGYRVRLLFLWLNNSDIAIQRVRKRFLRAVTMFPKK
jgi:predicted ABC-type ATPase